MSQTSKATNVVQENRTTSEERSENLRDSPMMAYLLDALEKGTDIGHYGRLTFVMVARHFLDEKEIVRLLSHQPDHNKQEAHTVLQQVKTHDYNPPKRERILEWQKQQDFPICPNPEDSTSCNVYRDLRFPSNIYENIEEYYEQEEDSSKGHK